MEQVTRLNAQKGDKIPVRINRQYVCDHDFYLVEGEVIHATKTRLKVGFTNEKGYKQQQVFSRDGGSVYPFHPNSFYRLPLEQQP